LEIKSSNKNHTEPTKNYHYKLLFFGIYFLEEFGIIITLQTLSYYLNNIIGLDPIIIGIYGGISFIPMILRIFIGPIVDKWEIPILGGGIKPYIFIGAILNAIFLMPLGLDPRSFFFIYFLCWFLQNLGLIIVDVGVDALAIKEKQLFDDKKSRTLTVALLMVAGTGVGNIFGSAFSMFFPIFTYPVGFIISGCISGLGIVIALIFKQKYVKRPSNHLINKSNKSDQNTGTITNTNQNGTTINLKQLFDSLTNKNIILGSIFAFFISFDTGLHDFTFEDFIFVQWGRTLNDLFFLSLIGTLAFFISLPIIYYLRKKVNKVKIIIFFSLYYAVFYLIWSILLGFNALTFDLYLITYALVVIIIGSSDAFYNSLFFDLSNEKTAATHIVIFFTFKSLGRVVGMMISGYIYNMGGMLLIFIISGLIMTVRWTPLVSLGKK